MCGKEGKIDCTKMYGRKKCDPSSNKFEKCVSKGTECDIYSYQDSCAGSILSYCDDGYVTKTDCAKLGFKTCGTLMGGSIEIGAVCK